MGGIMSPCGIGIGIGMPIGIGIGDGIAAGASCIDILMGVGAYIA